MASSRDEYKAKEREERRLASLAQGHAQLIHQLSADVYAELCRQLDETAPK